MEKVSIIIPFYNCQYVDKAVESALNQTYKNIEIIVIDDGSTKYDEKIQPYFSRVKYIKKGNGGTASALNMGIKNATGEYFSWLSSDDLYNPEKISKQVNLMTEVGAKVSYSPYYIINSNGEVINQINKFYPNKKELIKTALKHCPVNGCTVMTRMDVFSAVGYFDESLRYANDYDMWCRLLLNYEFFYIDEPLVSYRHHDKMGTKLQAKKINLETKFVKKKYRKTLRNYLFKLVNK
ncbi:glycosyltransferase [Bacillus sp. J37]|uniref:glycosyltransferase n=1 Tax=Bacillus sp. J37 TaxID=935837 RepID=UPI0004BC0880|nr:glycosyltransferase [Bacillus sp. J37]